MNGLFHGPIFVPIFELASIFVLAFLEMRINRKLLLLLSFCLSLGLQAQLDSAYSEMLDELLAHSVEELQVAEVDASDTSIVWLDARKVAEYQVSTIPNSIRVGYSDFDPKTLEALPKDAEIVVFCSVGYRSEKVAEELTEMGFENVSNLYGGIFQWVNEGKAVETPEGVYTQQVHAFDRNWGKWLAKGQKVYH